MQHDHGVLMVTGIGERSADPSVGVGPVTRDAVPQDAGVPSRDEVVDRRLIQAAPFECALGSPRSKVAIDIGEIVQKLLRAADFVNSFRRRELAERQAVGEGVIADPVPLTHRSRY
jgi:hypothetical protein